MRGKKSESRIQSEIKAELKKRGWLVIKNTVVHTAGFPDLTCFKNGKTIFIEVKRPGMKPTKRQYYWIDKLSSMKFPVDVCHSKEEAILFVYSIE